MKFVIKDASRGDIIRTQIGNTNLFHYGIYISEEEVIQFGYSPLIREKDKDNIVVISTSIDTFSQSNFVEVGECSSKEKKKIFHPEEIISRAKARLGEGGYNILHNNCEHFVYECAFGEKYCSQEEEVRNKWRALLKGNNK